MSDIFVHESSYIDKGVFLGAGTKVWHFSHFLKGTSCGENCSFGQNVMAGPNVKIGRNVKVQNNVAIYEGIEIEDDVFLGPSCVLTNVTNPRSQVVRRNLAEKTLLKKGCSIGANATIVCGVTIGRYAFIAAGAVVSSDVPDYALVQGVPGKRVGWMSRHGHKLNESEKVMTCPESGFRYAFHESGALRCLDLSEEDSLPENLSLGHKKYDEFKK